MSTESLRKWVEIHPDDIKAFNTICGELTKNFRRKELVSIATPVYERSRKTGNITMTISAGIYLGQTYLMMSEPDSMYRYFDEVSQLAKDNGMDKSLMIIYNSLGLHNLMYAMNYDEALHDFYQALALAQKSRDTRNKYLILSNIVNVYYLREDTTGLEIALDVYDYGKKSDDDHILYRGALGAAYMYYISGDYVKALEYANITEQLDTYRSGYSNSDAIHGDILDKLGRTQSAEQYYRRGVNQSRDLSTRIESHLSYGNFLLENRRYDEAIIQYHDGLKLVDSTKMYFYGHKLYNSLSEAYSATGRNDLAVRYMKTYQKIVDSVFSMQKERAFSSLRLQYEQERKENQLKEKDILILKQRQKTIIVSCITSVLLIVVAVIYILLRRRTAMYHNLVMRYDAQLKREKLMAEGPSEDKTSQDTKLKELFKKIESLMAEEQIYRMNDISLDVVADRLQTNRSYISKAVNTFAGSSFNAYINSYRIRKAVEMLSSTTEDIPIKAIAEEIGYNNLTSFYKNFQKETGVPPSKYRQEIIKISENDIQES